MPYINKDKLLQSITKEDVIKICTDLGAGNYKIDGNGDLIFNTVLCHGGNKDKLYYYHEPDEERGTKGRTFHCYTCGNQISLIELVIRAKRNLKGQTYTWYKALYYIAEITGHLNCTVDSIEREEEKNSTINDFVWINRFKRSIKVKKNLPNQSEINENILDVFCYIPHEEFLNDNISEEALSRYEIGYYVPNNSISIPHRDINERLIGIRERHLNTWDIENYGKYTPITIEGKMLNHKLGNNLYGIHVVKDRIKACGKCLLVEAEKSCMQSYSYFGEDSFTLAVCGNKISETQRRLLIEELQIKELILGFDKEYTDPHSFKAESYFNGLKEKVASFLPYCKVSLLMDTEGLLQEKDSPTDRGKDVLLQLLENKIRLD